MTIDAKNSVRIENSTVRIQGKPHGIVSGQAEGRIDRYDGRLFFCPRNRQMAVKMKLGSPKFDGPNVIFKQSRNCRKGAKSAANLRNCLAFMVKFYYNKGLYFVVGPPLMQGVAKLRKVAEVIRTGFNYLKLPHIANSKGTILVK